MVGPSSSSSDDLISSLDLGNLLHLQNSDFNSGTIISVKLTSTENYRVWAAAIKLAINTRNKTGFIDGTCLKSTYETSAPLSNRHMDTEKHNNRKSHHSSFTSMAIVLVQLVVVKGDDGVLVLSEAVSYLERLFLMSKMPLPLYPEKNLIDALPHPQVLCLNLKSLVLNNIVNTSGNNRGPNLNLLCKNCGKVGHTFERCFDIIGYPPWYNKNSSKSGVKFNFNANVKLNQTSAQNSPTLSFTNEQMMKLMSLINDMPSGSIQTNMASKASFRNHNVFFNINFHIFFNSDEGCETLNKFYNSLGSVPNRCSVV
ncbi:ribonuclease H-like domain-containing protein [Tanacetum coccineum]